MLSNALARIHQIIDDGVLHSRHGVAVGADTSELVGALVVLGQNGSLSHEHHRASLELLLQLGGQARLNQTEVLEQLVGNEHHDGLLVSSDGHLLRSSHLERLQGLGKILGLLGNLSNLVGNGDLEIVGLGSFGLQNHLHGLKAR